MSKTYLPTVNVEARVPWCSVWHDQIVIQRLVVEIKNFGCYGLVEVRMIFVMNIQVFFFNIFGYSKFICMLM